MVCAASADQRQAVGGKLTGIAAGQRENFTFACQLAEAEAIIEGDIQRLVESGFISLLHPLRFRWRQRPDDRAQVRIAERQEGQNTLAMERLACHRLMRLSGANRRHQRMMVVIPEGQRNIGLITQP